MKTSVYAKRIWWFWFLASLLVLIDQASKYWVNLALAPGKTVEVLSPVIYFTRVANTGAAFGFFARHTGLFIAVSAVIVLLAVVLSPRIASWGRWIRLALALEVGGAAGNLIDRVRLGYVVDFIDLRFWPVFNLADSAIVAGAVLLALILVCESREVGKSSGGSGS